MALSQFEKKRLEKLVGQYMEKQRPPNHDRDQLQLEFRQDGESVVIYEHRASWDHPATKSEIPVARATYVKSTKSWKLSQIWEDPTWQADKQFPTSTSLDEVLDAVNKDSHYCF